jgi:GcrA cell cycle regulator
MMPSPRDRRWPAERVERVKVLLKQGWSASQIGVAIGMTRNAVIGKVHRDNLGAFIRRQGQAGWFEPAVSPSTSHSDATIEACPESAVALLPLEDTLPPAPVPPAPLPPAPQVAKRRAARKPPEMVQRTINYGTGVFTVKIRAPREEKPVDADLKIPVAQRCSIMDLTADTCRWPVGTPGEPGFFFCGGATGGSVYCPGHTKRATQPAPPRSRPYIPAMNRAA